ncbi:PAS domain S-box protein [Mesorhizobium australicum]
MRSGERVEGYETVRRRKDGSLVPVSLTISPVRNASGRLVGASKIARDLSPAKESEHRTRTLMREVNHRVKNQHAIILSMIRETNKRSKSPDTFVRESGSGSWRFRPHTTFWYRPIGRAPTFSNCCWRN